MGSHSKKKKKDRRRSRSRSRSSERHKSRYRSRSESRSRSRSPSYRSSKHKKHHRGSRSRSRDRPSHSRRSSRSRSRERERSRDRDREKSSKHRRSRSRSLSRRSRSRSPERRRRRSRSSDRRSKRSKSRERQKSPARSPERSSRGGSHDSTKVKKEKDNAIDVDTNLNPVEAIHQKMRKALEAAASADAKLREQGLLSSAKQEPLSRAEQLERDQMLQRLESESFVPSAFVPSRDRQQAQPTYLTKEQTHDNAIFGGVGVANPALNGGQTYSYGIPITYKKRGQLASKYLAESAEEKEKRWLEKLQAMRKQKLEANPEYFNKLLTIKADSPSRD